MIKHWGMAAAFLALLGSMSLSASADPRPAISWSGDVDDTTIVYVHRSDVRTHDVFGKAAGNISSQVYSRLPEGPTQVFLEERHGRGRIRIVQQPNPSNDWTAAVRIHDPQPGRSHYDFTLAWNPLPIFGGPNNYQISPDHRFRGADGY